MSESWADIPGYTGLYRISSLGRVLSLRTGRMMRPSRGAPGYLHVKFSVNGIKETRTVHSLVLAAFSGERPEGAVGRHLNGDRMDNRAENLAWGTAVENAIDAVEHRAHHNSRKDACKRGHLFTPENTRVRFRPRLNRECRACQSIHASAARERARLAGR